MELEQVLLANLPELSQQILTLAKAHGRLSLHQMVELTIANHNTIKKHVAALVEDRQLILYGAGRGIWYSARL